MIKISFCPFSPLRAVGLCCAALTLAAAAQQAAPSAPASETPQAATQTPTEEKLAGPQVPQGVVTEEALKQLLVGKALYLRGGYLDNALSFNEHGRLSSHSAQGSYTLSAIEINRVRLTKHKVELEGTRYGLHFVGQLAYEDPAKAVDRVRITPKKKVVKITIDREMVVKPKKSKPEKKSAAATVPTAPPQMAAALPEEKSAAPQAHPAPPQMAEKSEADQGTAPDAPTPAAAPPQVAPQAQLAPPQVAPQAQSVAPQVAPQEASPADQLKASIAATPEADRPADAASVTTTTSPEHAARVLSEALDQVFAPGLDERMMAAMPDFWKLYYQAAESMSDYRPKDPSILRQNTVDKKARLLSTFEPDSNEYAQANGVAGMALYHTVIGTDGKAGEIAVGRPIGFGLDESAVESIRKARFEPAMKDGKPVPVLLDLVVQFRIYSNRTAAASPPDPAEKGTTPILPGPYSVPR